MTPDDMTLVGEFAANRSEPAFAALVERHLGLVYSSALRQTGDPHLAEEISQAVFIILARKAGSLGADTILPAWLYRTTRYAASNALKMERRRREREQEAYMQSTLETEDDAAAWQRLAPLLDEAMTGLSEPDRASLVLRYFENRPWNEVATAMRVSEDTAQKRGTRALEKLRKLFGKRGVTLSATLLTAAVSAHSVQAAPVGLAATVTTTAVHTATISGTLTPLVKGTMKLMTWMKYKFAVGLGATTLLVAGVATVAVSQTRSSDDRLTPLEIAQQSQAAYAALTSYADTGQTVASTGAQLLTNRFNIRLQRPELYRVDWAQPVAGAGVNKGVVWSSGDGHFLQLNVGGRDAYTQPENNKDRGSNLGTATGVSSMASATVPVAFFGDANGGNVLQLALRGKTVLTKEPDADIVGVPCHAFTAAIEGAKLPNQMGSMGKITTTLWIGKQDHLIHQLRRTMDTSHMNMPTMTDEQIRSILTKTGKPVTAEAIAAMRKTMETATQAARATKMVFTETHENIVVNQKYTAADFKP